MNTEIGPQLALALEAHSAFAERAVINDRLDASWATIKAYNLMASRSYALVAICVYDHALAAQLLPQESDRITLMGLAAMATESYNKLVTVTSENQNFLASLQDQQCFEPEDRSLAAPAVPSTDALPDQEDEEEDGGERDNEGRYL